MKSPKMFLKLPKLISIADKYVETDMNYGQLSYLAYYGVTLDKENIEQKTIDGTTKKGSPFYYVNKDSAKNEMKVFENMRNEIEQGEGEKQNIDFTEEELQNMTEEERMEVKQKIRDRKLREKLQREAVRNNSIKNNNLNDTDEN